MRNIRIPVLAAVLLGGFFAFANAQTYPGIFACAAHQWMSSIGIGGNPSCSQPAAADLSNGTTGSGGVVLATGPTISSAALNGANIQQALQTSGAITPTALAADVNDYNPTGLATATSIRQDGGAANRNITGLTAQAGGTEVSVFNIGANNLVLKTQSVSSAAANRFAIGADVTLAPGQSATLWYDGAASRWIAKSAYTIAGGAPAGTVTSVATTYPICGGPITTSGTGTYCGPTFSGRLTFTSATALNFGPLNGDTIRINGTVLQIPSGGIAGCGNTSVFVNGAGSSNLASSTFYYVYAFSNSGTVTCDFRTDGNKHLPDSTAGNIGTEVRVSSGTTRDSTRTLIGAVFTNGSSQFEQDTGLQGIGAVPCLCVVSWYNRRTLSVANFPASVNPTCSAGCIFGTNYAEIDATNERIEFLSWAEDAPDFRINGSANNSISGNRVYNAIGIDNCTSSLFAFSLITSPNTLLYETVAMAASIAVSEAQHFSTLCGAVDSGIAKWSGGSPGANGDNTSNWVAVRG